MAAYHGERSLSSPEVNLIPTGWHLVNSGPLFCGDKYWSPEKAAWFLVTVNSHYMAENFPAVIRKDNSHA